MTAAAARGKRFERIITNKPVYRIRNQARIAEQFRPHRIYIIPACRDAVAMDPLQAVRASRSLSRVGRAFGPLTPRSFSRVHSASPAKRKTPAQVEECRARWTGGNLSSASVDGQHIHILRILLDDPVASARNVVILRARPNHSFTPITAPTDLQVEAFQRLGGEPQVIPAERHGAHSNELHASRNPDFRNRPDSGSDKRKY